jgi:hypothetical protein
MNASLQASNRLGKMRTIAIWNVTRFVFGMALAVVLLNPAFAQSPGGTPGSNGGYTFYPKSIGTAAGAVAGAGASLLYWPHHHSGTITGCIQRSNRALIILEEKKERTYFLLPGHTGLRPDERIELAGKKLDYGLGAQFFQVKKVVKILGDCSGESKLNSTSTASN